MSVGSFKVDNSLQLGREASSNAANATAVGFQAKATALNSSAFGAGASATGTGSTAIGKGTLASQNNSIILGDHSDANIRVGIGTNTPTAKLQVSGTLRYVDGIQGTGKILTSDANGNASWQLPAVTETRGVQYYSYDIASTASPDLIELKTNSRISKSGDYNGDLVYSSVFNPSNDEDGFVVKITGTYLVKKSGNFIFTQSSDDGVRIYIDDVLILDDWKDSSRETTSSPAILLSAGKHKFDFWYYENAGGQSFSFSWGTNPDGNSGVMKASQFTVE